MGKKKGTHKKKCQEYRLRYRRDKNRTRKELKALNREEQKTRNRKKLLEKARAAGFDSYQEYKDDVRAKVKNKYAREHGYANYADFVKRTRSRIHYTVHTKELKVIYGN